MAPNRILLVEDEPTIRIAVRDALRTQGHEVDDTVDGAEGLRRAKAGGYDLLLLDVMLPGLDGLEVLKALRRGGAVVDRADSYFGMRTVAVERVGGVMRTTLNGEFLPQTGTLDQGYWPDGIYTAPTDADWTCLAYLARTPRV